MHAAAQRIPERNAALLLSSADAAAVEFGPGSDEAARARAEHAGHVASEIDAKERALRVHLKNILRAKLGECLARAACGDLG
jgi:hypothetical protein